jgi:orotate phosphoribosyltransferase
MPVSNVPDIAQQKRIARLTALLAERSARRGQFTLASGRQSTLYIDARLTTMHPAGLLLIGPAGLAALDASPWGRTVTAVGGLTLGADPIAYAISYASALVAGTASGTALASGAAARESPGSGRAPLRAFTVRKEPKAHGTGKQVEGAFQPGDHVAIIEDVITTGGSARRAVDAVRNAEGIVAGVLALVDREEGGREALEADGLAVIALVLASEIVAQMKVS